MTLVEFFDYCEYDDELDLIFAHINNDFDDFCYKLVEIMPATALVQAVLRGAIDFEVDSDNIYYLEDDEIKSQDYEEFLAEHEDEILDIYARNSNDLYPMIEYICDNYLNLDKIRKYLKEFDPNIVNTLIKETDTKDYVLNYCDIFGILNPTEIVTRMIEYFGKDNYEDHFKVMPVLFEWFNFTEESTPDSVILVANKYKINLTGIYSD